LASPDIDRRGTSRAGVLGRRVYTIEYIDATTGATLDGLNGNPPPRNPSYEAEGHFFYFWISNTRGAVETAGGSFERRCSHDFGPCLTEILWHL
jgi:hypothetical protein